MNKLNFNNYIIISLICLFIFSCSSTQLLDISKDDELDLLIESLEGTKLKIKTNEDVKKLLIKSLIKLNSDISISFVDTPDNETINISNNFLDQKFAYFCKSPHSYLDEITKEYLFSTVEIDEVFIFYSRKFLSRAEIISNNYPGAKIFLIESDYDSIVKDVFELKDSYSRSDLINKLVKEEDINFIPRPRKDFKRIFIIADYDQSKNFIPSLKFNYILDREIISSAQSILKIEDRRKLLDFSDIVVTVPNSFMKDKNYSNLDELSKLSFLNDLIIISAMKKKNLSSQNINGRFANIRYVQNSCSDMSMDVVKINDLGDFSLL